MTHSCPTCEDELGVCREAVEQADKLAVIDAEAVLASTRRMAALVPVKVIHVPYP